MSAQLIFDLVPLGSLLNYSDGSPRPPERHRKKLAAWDRCNGSGRLIRKQRERRIGNVIIPASITLHEGDYGSGGVVVLVVNRTYPVNSGLSFAVVERPPAGSVRILDRSGEDTGLLHLAASRIAAEAWLKTHIYPHAVLDEVTADETGAAIVEGRAVA